MKKVPSKVVAAPGYSTLVNIGNRGLQITQFTSVDLTEYFAEEEIQESQTLRDALRQGWVIPYTGQKLPEKRESKIKIPKMKIGHGAFSAKIKVVEKKKEGKKSDYEYDVDISDEVQKTIQGAQDKKEREKSELKEELKKRQKEELETDRAIKDGKVDISEVKTIRVDGQDIPIKKFKAPGNKKKKVKETEVNVDVQKKKAVKKEEKVKEEEKEKN